MSVCVNFQYFAILCCNSEVSPSSHFGWNPQIFCNIAIVLTLKYWLPPILDRTPQFFCNILVVTVKYWLPPILDGTPQFFCYIIFIYYIIILYQKWCMKLFFINQCLYNCCLKMSNKWRRRSSSSRTTINIGLRVRTVFDDQLCISGLHISKDTAVDILGAPHSEVIVIISLCYKILK